MNVVRIGYQKVLMRDLRKLQNLVDALSGALEIEMAYRDGEEVVESLKPLEVELRLNVELKGEPIEALKVINFYEEGPF